MPAVQFRALTSGSIDIEIQTFELPGQSFDSLQGLLGGATFRLNTQYPMFAGTTVNLLCGATPLVLDGSFGVIRVIDSLTSHWHGFFVPESISRIGD